MFNEEALAFDPLTLPRPSVDLMRAARRSEATPEAWTEADIERAIDRYRHFLKLCQDNPGAALAPTRDIDVIWHLHMLSPRAYHADCLALFGDILDHDGGFGATDDERPVLIDIFEQTADRWRDRFGEPYVAEAAGDAATSCWHDCVNRCWHACKSVEAGGAVATGGA